MTRSHKQCSLDEHIHRIIVVQMQMKQKRKLISNLNHVQKMLTVDINVDGSLKQLVLTGLSSMSL